MALLSEFIHSVMRNKDEDDAVLEIVERVWNTFKCSAKAGGRKTVSPSLVLPAGC